METKSDYKKLVADACRSEGMFIVYQKKNDYYFEIPVRLLGGIMRHFGALSAGR